MAKHKLPTKAEKIEPDADGAVALARGEVTGHRHAFYGGAVMFRDATTGGTFVVLEAPAALKHEEHSAPVLPKGTYGVVYQREYHPEAIRRVVD